MIIIQFIQTNNNERTKCVLVFDIYTDSTEFTSIILAHSPGVASTATNKLLFPAVRRKIDTKNKSFV